MEFKPDDQSKEYPHHDACGISAAMKEGEPSFDFLQEALEGCGKLDHRGGDLPQDSSGDGIGIATSTPLKWVHKRVSNLGLSFQYPEHASAGLLFLSRKLGSGQHHKILSLIQKDATNCKLRIVGFEEAPFQTGHLGKTAQESAPVPYYVYFEPLEEPSKTEPSDFPIEKDVYKLQQMIESKIEAAVSKGGHPPDTLRIVSLSPFSIVHKGMGNADDLKKTWPALSDEDFEVSQYALHRRFSTNTFPEWWLAQPFFMLLHNGEINTIIKNRSTLRQLEKNLRQATKHAKVLSEGGSDTADMDRGLQHRYMAFRSFYKSATALLVALETIMPAAYYSPFSQVKEDFIKFIRFHRRHLGGGSFFGGPAFCIAWIRDTIVGKVDNMALRPAKWAEKMRINAETGKGERAFYMASEFGAIPNYLEDNLDAGILGPGDIIMATRNGVLTVTKKDDCRQLILDETHSKDRYHTFRPMDVSIEELKKQEYQPEQLSEEEITGSQARSGWKQEQKDNLDQIAATGKLPVSAMGTPWPMAALREPLCSTYEALQQRFAQVTNPPIDHIRENDKMDLTSRLGGRRYNPNVYTKEPIEQIRLSSPIMTNEELHHIKNQDHFPTTVLDCSIEITENSTPEDLKKRIGEIAQTAIKEVAQGARILVLSHRPSRGAQQKIPLEMPLILGAVAAELNTYNLRQFTSIVTEGDDIKESHDMALLLSMGANAVNPSLAEDSLCDGVSYVPEFAQESAELKDGKKQQVGKRITKKTEDQYRVKKSREDAISNLYKGYTDGLKKIMAKMGINDIDGYRGSGLFEVIGLGEELQPYLGRLTPSRIGGQGFAERLKYLQEQQEQSKNGSLQSYDKLPNAWKQRSVEKRSGGIQKHLIPVLQKLFKEEDIENLDFFAPNFEIGNIPLETLQRIFDSFRDHRKLVGFGQDSEAFQIRDLFQIEGIDLETLNNSAVTAEDWERATSDIIPRLKAGHMSFGALLKWAKEAIEMGMNAIGTYGGSGEGGIPREMMDSSKPKSVQVASGRFGVTAEYLAGPQVQEICIKMGQGAKPGEGGQLPGFKVSYEIADNRYCEEGTELISPPPHHDIYSIEELTQLIEDLRSVNPTAKIAIKLVSGTGIGTIAAGVVKTGADIIEIDGYEGGTGARNFESHHAGLPTEFGIREVHQTLTDHGLRDRVIVRALGGIKSAQDMLKYQLMGADQVGCGTLAMVALNCNLQANCNVGCGIQIAHPLASATKLFEELKTIMNDDGKYTEFVQSRAKQVSLLFIALGLELAVMHRHLQTQDINDQTGNTEKLKRRSAENSLEGLINTDEMMNLSTKESELLEQQKLRKENLPPIDHIKKFKKRQEWKHLETYEKTGEWPQGTLQLESAEDRSFGSAISGSRIRSKTKTPLKIQTAEYAGNSYGAFASEGMTLIHRGSAEEGVAKGISEGAVIAIHRPDSFKETSRLHMPLVSNNVGFGATGGKIFVDSVTGQRCGIRLSGKAELFARGGGEYAAEYMTGGTIILLPDPKIAGSYQVVCGKFGAGMSGGEAYVFVQDRQKIAKHLDENMEILEIIPETETHQKFLEKLESFRAVGLSDEEYEYWAKNISTKKGRVVCIRPRRKKEVRAAV
jgi:glutamate synthase domain-containing protein 2/glutamate synthase domain-containing protein 1/glutamate synthase domain-containing protein 3